MVVHRGLGTAAAGDPLRAHLPWRSLSWLAEITDHPEEAWRYVEQAHEANPLDTWTLFQRGRLFAQRDDWEGARAAFQRALESELDFEDALLAQGELAFRLGRFEEAERYLERAVTIGGQRADAHALRGLNLLQLDRIEDAQLAFLAARSQDPDDPVALNGLAWCEYRLGDSTEAIIQLGIVDEKLRDRPETDPHRVWAREQQERIKDHDEKEAWMEAFGRSDTARLRNGWYEDESYGPDVNLVSGAAVLAGSFSQGGEARLWRGIKASLFVAIEADLWVTPQSVATVGMFVMHERVVRGTEEPLSGVSVQRHKDGTLQYAITRPAQPDEPEDVKWLDDFQPGRWVRLRIERTGEPGDHRVTITVDGTPIAEDLPMPDLGRAQTEIKVGFFARGDLGRQVELRVDNVELVRRKIQ